MSPIGMAPILTDARRTRCRSRWNIAPRAGVYRPHTRRYDPVRMAVQKLSYDNGGDFIRETRQDVDRYLGSRRVRVRGRLQLYAKAVVAFSLLLGSWTVLVFVRPGLWPGVACFAGLVV